MSVKSINHEPDSTRGFLYIAYIHETMQQDQKKIKGTQTSKPDPKCFLRGKQC